MKVLLVINDAPYGSEKAYNALRLAMAIQAGDSSNGLLQHRTNAQSNHQQGRASQSLRNLLGSSRHRRTHSDRGRGDQYDEPVEGLGD